MVAMLRRHVVLLTTVPVLALSACANDGDSDDASVPTASVSPSRSTTTTPGAATTDLSSIEVRLTKIAEVDAPTALAPRAGSDDLFVAERDGAVRRLARSGDTFEVDRVPTLDVRAGVAGDLSGERGLLGLTFSPDGSELLVSYTDGDDNGASVIAAYRMTGDVADPASRREILRLPQPFSNHNGGNIAFGPDGYLYVGFGDGGSQGDPSDNGQSRSTLLAKLLRLDVSGATTDGGYTVPSDNPFVGVAGARNEIWATGLRNPWRFSFDRATGDLWIGDVGGSDWEEIDVLPAATGGGRGANLGWSLREGAHDTDKAGDRTAAFVEPVFEYSHDEGASVTGGFVYRGTERPDLDGVYLFSDFAAAKLRGLTVRNGNLDRQAIIRTVGDDMSQVASFGQDNDGELYLLNLSGEILALG